MTYLLCSFAISLASIASYEMVRWLYRNDLLKAAWTFVCGLLFCGLCIAVLRTFSR